MNRRQFLKRLVGLGVGVLGVHEALKAPTPPVWSVQQAEANRHVSEMLRMVSEAEVVSDGPFVLFMHHRTYRDLCEAIAPGERIEKFCGHQIIVTDEYRVSV